MLNFSFKPILKNKIKRELERYDETIKEMIIYENIQKYVQEISQHLKDFPNKKIYQALENSKTFDTETIKNIATLNNDVDLLLKLDKGNMVFKGKEDHKLAKEMFIAEYNRPNLSTIENVAFSGGGAKGIAHVGTLRSLKKHGANIKAVSGTSAGAITALPFALGYSPHKLSEIVNNYDFTSFLQESVLNDSSLGAFVTTVSSNKRALMYRTVYFASFVKNFEKPFAKFIICNNLDKEILKMDYNDDLSENKKIKLIIEKLKSTDMPIETLRLLQTDNVAKDLKFVVQLAQGKAEKDFEKEIRGNEKNISKKALQEKLNLGFRTSSDAISAYFRITRKKDLIEEFFGDLIERKIMPLGKEKLEKVEKDFSKIKNVRNMNFTQFEKLRKLYPELEMKNLGICICEEISSNPLKLFKKENYRQIDVHSGCENPEYSEMPIKTAVRISMNLPGAFSVYEYKGKNYVDGGVRANFPLHFFDKTLNQPKNKTIGFSLVQEDNYTRTSDVNEIISPSNPVELMKPNPLERGFKNIINKISNYYDRKIYGKKLDNNEKMGQLDFLRVAFINVFDVGTNDFGISKNKKKKLIMSGSDTCDVLLSPDYNAQMQNFKKSIVYLRDKLDSLDKKYKDKYNKTSVISNFSYDHKKNMSPLEEALENNISNFLSNESDKKILAIRKEIVHNVINPNKKYGGPK